MQPVEITLDLHLTDAEKKRLELHSFHNVLNVIYGEIQILQLILEDPEAFPKSLALLENILKAFQDRSQALFHVHEIEDYKSIILNEIRDTLDHRTIPEAKRAMLEVSLAHLDDILKVVEIRVREILARQQAPGRWERFTCEEILRRMRQVFDVIAEGSQGRYNIVYTPKKKGEKDYLLLLQVAASEPEGILMPPVLLDSFRDLTANARKYTAPGGRIEASLVDDGSQVTVRVLDTGRGIPANEIPRVVEYGYRGSNTTSKETKGGGYGLTKAYYVCKQFGGRMWIASEVGVGTIVTLTLPRPD